MPNVRNLRRALEEMDNTNPDGQDLDLNRTDLTVKTLTSDGAMSATDLALSGTLTKVGGDKTLMVDIGNNTTYAVLAADSGKLHMIPDLTSDIVISLPTAAAGLLYEFWYSGVATEVQDWQFDTGSDTNFFLGGVVQLDDVNAIIRQGPNGSSNSIMNLLLPDVGTIIKMYCDATNWFLTGSVVSSEADAVTWADQA